MLEGLCEEVYNIWKKDYIYKLDDKGRFVTEMQGHRLVDRDLDLSVSTFRKEQTLKLKFPSDFWMKSDV